MKKLFPVILISLFAFLLVLKPEICKNSIANSIILCSRVLIPSLFPFSVCVLFIMKSGIIDKIKFLSPVTERIFGLSVEAFSIMLLSMLGGYPIGAKLINNALSDGQLTEKDSGVMLNFCINAGPAFIISAVGDGILHSNKLGYILLFSHIVSSFIICIFYSFICKKSYSATKIQVKKISPADNFVLSASEGASVTINICSFVILFSAITAYIEHFSNTFTILKPILYLTEVTLAVTKTNSIYLISFLLGFAGFCIWCQILSVGKNIKINFISFLLCRIIHGALSCGITALIIKISKTALPTFSNNLSFNASPSVSGTALSVALLIMGIIFIISLSNHRNSTKILEEFT